MKGPLQIDLAETKFDAQLEECITSASALVDGFMKPHGLAVPVVVPQLSRMQQSFMLPGCLGGFSDPVGAEAFWAEANRFLQSLHTR